MRLQHHVGSLGSQRSRHHRRYWRGFGPPGLRERIRCADWTPPLAILGNSRSGRTRQRDMERRVVEIRRRVDLDHRDIRSGTRLALLGHRQSGRGFLRRRARGRQPLYRFGRRPRSRYWRAAVVLPADSARCLGLRHGLRNGVARSRGARSEAPGAPQSLEIRVCVAAGSRERRVSRSLAVGREFELDREHRPAGPADRAQRAGSRRNELHLPGDRRRAELESRRLLAGHGLVLLHGARVVPERHRAGGRAARGHAVLRRRVRNGASERRSRALAPVGVRSRHRGSPMALRAQVSALGVATRHRWWLGLQR